MKGLITSQHDGYEISFSEQGWFNATQAASKFNKSVHEWIRLPLNTYPNLLEVTA